MFDARKRVCEWIFLDARNRRVLMLGNGRLNFEVIIDMGLSGHEQVGGERRKAGEHVK